MKRLLAAVVLVLFLPGCGGKDSQMNRALALRERLQAGSASFEAEITADYGDKLFTFLLDCRSDPEGNLSFEVREPESIAGISGSITGTKGKMTFDGTALAFPMLADGLLAPVTAPWVFLKTLRTGYLSSAGMEGELLRLCMDDSYQEDALHVDVWVDGENVPQRAEILHEGRKYLSLAIHAFTIS